jgi:hypothetical protein
MDAPDAVQWVAFGGKRLIASGSPRQVAERLIELVAARPELQPQVFEACSSRPVEIDLRGARQAVLRRLSREHGAGAAAPAEPAAAGSARGPGRPRLGVVAREVTLLPRHWDWLAAQPGGASVALRKLVERALRDHREADRARLATEAAYRFMHAMAGDEPGFEEASRALFASDAAASLRFMARWPKDVREHAAGLVGRIAAPEAASGAPAAAAPRAVGIGSAA